MCLTAKGQQCKNKAKEGTIYCGRHQTCKRPMGDAEIQTVKMEETTGDKIDMLDRDGNVMKTTCSKARKDVDLQRVVYQNNQFLYGNVPLKLTTLGSGTNGDVYAARSEDGSIELALKEMKYEGDLEVEKEAFRLIGKGRCKIIEGMENQNMIVMPMMDGDMRPLIGKLHPSTVVKVCRSLAQTLRCLFAKNIMYTDIKPANTLYKCTGRGAMDILLGDVGDVFELEDGETYDEYVSTFPYPYKNERKDAEQNDYFDLLEPITRGTAEHHLVWGVACFFFVMTSISYKTTTMLAHGRDHTNEEFMTVRNQLAKSVKAIPDAAVFAKALVDPTTVSLADMIKETREYKKPKRDATKQCTRRKGRCQVLRPGEDVADDCEFNMGSGRCRSAKKIKKEKPQQLATPKQPAKMKVRDVSLTAKEFDKMQVMGYKELRPREIEKDPSQLDKYIGWYASEKIDGWQAIWDGKGTLYTKSYKRTFAVPDSWMRLLPKIPMTGEIKIRGMDATKTASLMKDNPLWNETYFHVFDVVGANANKPFSERVRIIEETVDAACRSIKDCPLIAQPQIIMESRDQILAFYRDVLGKSGEGLVITNPTSKYDAGKKRSNERVKLKGRNDAEGEVIGYNMGGKKGLRSLDIAFNGITFHLGIGFKNVERENPETYFPIGTMVTFSYRELTKNGKPKEARFVRVRGDI
jgi:DNA ligase 1